MKNFLSKIKLSSLLLASAFILASCSQNSEEIVISQKEGNLSSEILMPDTLIVDNLIVNGMVYVGDRSEAQALDIAICQNKICGVFPREKYNISAKDIIDATGKIVSPGFIDPHTHTLAELLSQDKNHNLNYLTQGVTTVVNGNDGEGPVNIEKTALQLEKNGIGTNVALLVGHGSVRLSVMNKAPRFATKAELVKMEQLLTQAMKDGAIGFSTGLYYVPGSYANTEEVIRLATIAGKYQGIYDTHLRDESTFNIGFSAALDEAIDIAKQANIHLHLAHIKALGVDVWGQSKLAIDKITQAQKNGISISADQYPWLASGTKLHSAVMPKWVMADSTQAFHLRLNDPTLTKQLHQEIKENIRRRGGTGSILVTAYSNQDFHNIKLEGLTLKAIAQQLDLSAVEAAIQLVQQGEVRIASFNMAVDDVERFMVQPWVVTSSDGTNGHPRKYASFPKKYQEYVKNKKTLSLSKFIHQSSGKTADILGLTDRGYIKKNYQADIIIFDQQAFSANADFSHWDKYSSGIEYVFVNGQEVITKSKYQGKLAGKFLRKN